MCAALFAVLLVQAWGGGSFGWDPTVQDFVADVVPIADEEVHVDPYVDVVVVAAGLLTAAAILALLRRRRFGAAVFPVLAIGGASVLNLIVKAAVDRPAIENADGSGASFPSGTATLSMATAAALVLLAPESRRALAAALGALFVVAIATVIVWEEWHYPSDVLAGWFLALAWTALAWLALLRAQRSNAPASGAL